jgi:gamma-glutamyl:cysteine ligase YbdK (ATP-grasp superfamily)
VVTGSYTLIDLESNHWTSTEAEVRKELEQWETELEQTADDMGIMFAVEELREILADVKKRDKQLKENEDGKG